MGFATRGSAVLVVLYLLLCRSFLLFSSGMTRMGAFGENKVLMGGGHHGSAR